MAAKTVDLAVVGHFSLDTLSLPSRAHPFNVLGGPAAYTSFAAKRLDAAVSVISKVGEDFPDAYFWWLQQEGIDVSAVVKQSNAQTTRYELTYGKELGERSLKLLTKGPPITPLDLPSALRARAIHVAPIANEVSLEVVEKLKGSCDVLSLDPQGLIRSFDENGNVNENGVVENEIFSLINICKSSQTEIYALTGEPDLKAAIRAIHDVGVETVIVTLGAKGCVLSVEGAQYVVPAFLSEVAVDPTGAGDVFIGGFLTEYLKGKESLWCAAVGSAAASCVVEGIGPTYFGEKEEIYRRAQCLYEKELKQ